MGRAEQGRFPIPRATHSLVSRTSQQSKLPRNRIFSFLFFSFLFILPFISLTPCSLFSFESGMHRSICTAIPFALIKRGVPGL